MPRIRTIKPEFFGDEKLAALPPVDRFVFLGLISMADDAGRLVDNVKTIDGFLFPKTDDSSRNSLETLFSLARIVRYTSGSGQELIQITNWKRHQKVNHPSSYVLPAPPKQDKDLEAGRELSPATRKKVSRKSLASTNDLRPTINDHSVAIHATWLTPYVDLWRSVMQGTPNVGQMAKALKPLHDEKGPERLRMVLSYHLHDYVDHGKAQFVSLPKFASTYGLIERAALADLTPDIPWLNEEAQNGAVPHGSH